MTAIPWSRPEPFGAWVRLDDSTLVAVDHDLAAKLGVTARAPDLPTRPLEVHTAVTARCPAGCTGCYLDARPAGEHPAFEELVARLDEAARLGASTVAFGGGEPLSRDDLPRLAEHARARGLVPVMTTSGIGLSADRARTLGAFAQVNVSYDGASDAYAAVRGFEGASIAERAIAWLADASVPVGINVVLTRASFPTVEATIDRAASLGAREVQLLRYKPAGRAIGPSYYERRLHPEQVAGLWPMIERVASAGKVRVRIDCAMVPLLSAALAELPGAAERLEGFGVFGCEAGRHLGSLHVSGGLAPCSFMPPATPTTDLTRAWSEPDAELAALRAYHADLPAPCATCSLRSVCRGGCQVVSAHARGQLAPDPECPRVIAHRELHA